MDRNDPYDVARAVVAMKPWARAERHSWGLLTQSHAEPFIVVCGSEKSVRTPVAGRLMLFPGVAQFRDFVIARQMPDFGVGMSPLEFQHYEVVGLRSGGVEIFSYRPGFVPLPPDDGERKLLATLLYECYGVLLRMEEKPDLPLTYMGQKAMFARKEVVEGVWMDGPLRMPEETVVEQVEQVNLKKTVCDQAKSLPLYPKEIWELDFVLLPSYRTAGPNPRFLYLLVAVNAESGERMVWERLTVDGKEGGLLRLWSGHAQRVLDAVVRLGRVPGEIHMRSGRVMRFLRPLGLQLPFKLVQHAKLPSLESVLNLSIQTGKV